MSMNVDSVWKSWLRVEYPRNTVAAVVHAWLLWLQPMDIVTHPLSSH